MCAAKDGDGATLRSVVVVLSAGAGPAVWRGYRRWSNEAVRWLLDISAEYQNTHLLCFFSTSHEYLSVIGYVVALL